jgi:hypothetical protein
MSQPFEVKINKVKRDVWVSPDGAKHIHDVSTDMGDFSTFDDEVAQEGAVVLVTKVPNKRRKGEYYLSYKGQGGGHAPAASSTYSPEPQGDRSKSFALSYAAEHIVAPFIAHNYYSTPQDAAADAIKIAGLFNAFLGSASMQRTDAAPKKSRAWSIADNYGLSDAAKEVQISDEWMERTLKGVDGDPERFKAEIAAEIELRTQF